LGQYAVEYYAQSRDERLLGRDAVIAGVEGVFSKGSMIATRAPRQTPAAVVTQVAANHQNGRLKYSINKLFTSQITSYVCL
jgi:hypothetical protein